MLGMYCIICDSFLQWSCSEYRVDEELPPVNDGINCYSVGNYGSTVFDESIPGGRLEFAVCDPCLMAKQARVMVVVKDVLKKATNRPWKHDA